MKVLGKLSNGKAALLCFVLAASLAALPAWAKMYKWVDEKGRVHYGDSVPPEYAGQAMEELDERGLVRGRTQRTRLTPAELRRLEQDKARRAEEQRVREATGRRDRALLSTYTSEQEIDLARDRALEQEDMVIRGMDSRLKQVDAKLGRLRGEAGGYTAQSKPVPEQVRQELAEVEQEAQQLQKNIEQHRHSKVGIRTRHDADKQRFRELTGANQAPAPAP
jgi:Domain of unknown function (DUF4124)